MTNEEQPWSPEREEALKQHIKQAEQIVAWIESMPAVDKFGQSLVLGLLAGRSAGGPEEECGVAEEEIEKIVRWSTDRLIELVILGGVIRAHIAMRWSDDTDQPQFKLTATGREAGVASPEDNYGV